MNLPQENFDRALRSGAGSLSDLADAAQGPAARLLLKSIPKRKLETMAWDLEAIGAAIRLELMHRENVDPIDFG